MTKPRIEFRSSGESGNTLYILAMFREAMRKQRRIDDYNATRDRVLAASSYGEALAVMRELADITDLDGRY
jgi:hypothetical protein